MAASLYTLYDLVERYREQDLPQLLTLISREMHIPLENKDELFTPDDLEDLYLYFDATFPRLRAQAGLHSHRFFEVLYIVESDEVQYLIEAERYSLRKGDCVIIPPGVPHSPFFDDLQRPRYKRFVLWISPAFLSAQERLFPDTGYSLYHCERKRIRLLRPDAPASAHLFSLFCDLLRERQQKGFGWKAATAHYASLLLLFLGRCFQNEQSIVRTESFSLFDAAFRYLNDHMAEKISIQSVAAHLHVSASTVSHLFQKHINTSFYHCLTQCRLLQAKNLMARSVPLREAAEQCGFLNYSSFYRMFKKEFGISPREFLRQRPPAVQERG